MSPTKKIKVEDVEITIFEKPDQNDFICITDIVKLRTDDARAADIIKNWLRTRSTIEFLGTWEALYNPSFKVVDFYHFRKEAGLAELQEHPRTGTGKPELLSGDRAGQWSRRISQKHRLVYEIEETIVKVDILSAYGHYEDK